MVKIGSIPMSATNFKYSQMKTEEQIKIEKESIEFFEALILLTNSYFLSDYVEDYGEFDEKIVSKQLHNILIERRDQLREKCEKNGIDFHQISCDVAQVFLNKIDCKL